MAEIKNRIGEFLLSGQVLREAEEEFADGGGEGPGEGSPQSGESLQTLESIRKQEAGALPPADNHRASYAHPTSPQAGPVSAEADLQGDDRLSNDNNPGRKFGKQTERSLWDHDEDEEDEEGEDKTPASKVEEAIDLQYLKKLQALSLPELERLNAEVGQARASWSGNKADPYFPVYLQALKKGKAIQQAIKLKKGGVNDHSQSSNPIHTRSRANRAWEGLDPKILVRKMVERGMSDEEIRFIMKTQFAEAKNAYAVGMAAAEKETGDTPPLEKSTITKAHKIAKAIKKEDK